MGHPGLIVIKISSSSSTSPTTWAGNQAKFVATRLLLAILKGRGKIKKGKSQGKAVANELQLQLI